ncbi:hypothetical protein BX286_3973 [Streptomyces sp. 3211.6]|nr:hypothetical protein BX286_3973 [Streptomyces sp. 3211.6]
MGAGGGWVSAPLVSRVRVGGGQGTPAGRERQAGRDGWRAGSAPGGLREALGLSRQSHCPSGPGRPVKGAPFGRVATRSPAATLDRTARTGKTRTAGKPPKGRHGPSMDIRGISDQASRSGAASPGIRADRIAMRGRNSRQIATRSRRLSVRRPPGAAARRKGRQNRHPGPGGATDRYALLPSQRPPPAWGRCPQEKPTESASGTGRRDRSLRAPQISASGGRLGLIPAPNADRKGIRDRRARQIATRCRDLGVRRPSWADTRSKGRWDRHRGPAGRARSLRAPRISAAAGRPGLTPARKGGGIGIRVWQGAPDRYALLPSRRPLPVWGRCLHQMPMRGPSGHPRRPRSLRAPVSSASDGRPGPGCPAVRHLVPPPAQDGARTPRSRQRVAIWRAYCFRMFLWLAFGAGISPDGRRTPGREERVAICRAHRPRMTAQLAFRAGNGPGRSSDAGIRGARSDLGRLPDPDADPVALGCRHQPQTGRGRRNSRSA